MWTGPLLENFLLLMFVPEVWLHHGCDIRVSHFVNQKRQLRIKRTIFGSQKIISEIKRTGQESQNIIILMILLEYSR